MTDFRMNKGKPIGKRTLSTIAGYTPVRRPKPAPPKPEPEPEPKQAFEVTPDLSETTEAEEMPVANALGAMITPVEESDEGQPRESSSFDGQSDEPNRGDSGPGDEEPETRDTESGAADDAGEVVEDNDDSGDADEGDVESDAATNTSVEEESDSDAEGSIGDDAEVSDSDGENSESDDEDEAEAADSEVEDDELVDEDDDDDDEDEESK